MNREIFALPIKKQYLVFADRTIKRFKCSSYKKTNLLVPTNLWKLLYYKACEDPILKFQKTHVLIKYDFSFELETLFIVCLL